MDKIKKNLNSIGLGLLFAAFVASRVWPAIKPVSLGAAVLGAAAIVVYLILNRGQLKQGMKRRSFLYSSNLLLMIVLMLAIIVVLNILGSRYHQRLDFTEARTHSLSDQSIKVVKALKNDINLKAFFREGNMGRARMEDLLKIYTYHSPKVKFEFIDPDKNPGLVKRYEVTADGTTILEAGDKDTRITGMTEEDITNALIKITREKKKILYFLEGHGELSTEVTEEEGISFAKDELAKLGYEVKKQSLALSDSFPKDCAVLVIPGPKKDLLPTELETISKYLESGGRVLFLVEAQVTPGLIPYLVQYGFKLENDLMLDPASRMIGGDYFMPFIDVYQPHEITRNFRYATFFPFARSIELIEPKPENVITSTALGKTSADSYAKRDFTLKPKMTLKEVAFDKTKDKAGPMTIAAVATLKTKTADASAPSGSTTEGRMAVLGDSDFSSNRYFNFSGNGNFFLNIVNWLAQESDLISIQPKTSNPRTIQLSPAQGSLMFWVSVIILPLFVLAFGISIWLRRRAL